MKTERQRQRDAKSGIIGLIHEFNEKTGKIEAKGKIRQEFDPTIFLGQREMFQKKIEELKDIIENYEKQLNSLPNHVSIDVEQWLELQKKAISYKRRQELLDQIRARKDELAVLEDDWKEQENLLALFKKWKERK